MNRFSASPSAAVRGVWLNRSLLRSLVNRDVMGRYQGSMAGLLWSLFHPLFMLAVYTFFFSVIFKARWGEGSQSKVEFALVAFVGLILFNLFVECLHRAPLTVVSNTNFVKKVVFPLEILPVVVTGSALFHAAVSTGVWLVFYVVFFGAPSWTALFFPLVVLPLTLFGLGVGWFLASLGVYLRDVSQIVTVLTGALMFLSPIFYPVSAMPPAFQHVLRFNPLTPAIESARGVLMFGQVPSPEAYVRFLSAGLLAAWIGFAWFQKTRRGFADVL